MQHLISRLHVHVSEEDRADEVVSEVEGLRLRGQEDETLGVLLVALAALQEQDEVLEGLLRDRIVILHEEFHGLAQKDWVLLFDADLNNQVNER